MTGAQWRMARRVLEVLTAEVGMTDHALARRLGVTEAELRPVVGALIRQHRADSCWTGTEGYVVLSAASAQEVSAA